MCVWKIVIYIFFFKQKTAYEMRISDWSSDVCSSDLLHCLILSFCWCMCKYITAYLTLPCFHVQQEDGSFLSMENGSDRTQGCQTASQSARRTERSVSEFEAKNARLRKELASARLDAEVLGKATAYFAKGLR